MYSKPALLRKFYPNCKNWTEIMLENLKAEHNLGNSTNSWVKLKLPYKAAENPVLPSIDDVETRIVYSRGICRYEHCIVKKDNNPTILQEAENMLFLAEHSQVNVAKVYAAFVRSVAGVKYYYLIQEYVEGQHLTEETLQDMTEESRDILCSRLSEQFRLLRSVLSENYYGRVYRQAFPPTFNHLRLRYTDMCGPYDDLRDPHWRNIIAQPIYDNQGQPKDWHVTLIDWERFGWYPEYLQVIQFQNWAELSGVKDLSNDIVTKVFPDTAFTYDYVVRAMDICLFL